MSIALESVGEVAKIDHRYTINTSLVKYVFQLATLEFPPKKLFGNKDERVVAERRSHLEVTELSFPFSVY